MSTKPMTKNIAWRFRYVTSYGCAGPRVAEYTISTPMAAMAHTVPTRARSRCRHGAAGFERSRPAGFRPKLEPVDARRGGVMVAIRTPSSIHHVAVGEGV